MSQVNQQTASAGLAGFILCAWLVACGNATAQSNAFDNAALDYWKAGALLRPILSQGELEAAVFIEKQLHLLPPRVFSLRPEAARWLLEERPMLLALHDGVDKPYCQFNPPGVPEPDLTYRGVMGKVIRRALAAASAFEFIDSEGTTSRIYVDVLRLVDHLDDDMTWSSAYDAMGRLPAVQDAIAGFLSRNPARQSIEPLNEFLSGMQRPVHSIDELLREEMRGYVRGLLTDVEGIDRNVLSFYKEGEAALAANLLLPLDEEGKKKQLVAWLDGYQNEVSGLALAASRPYPEAIRIIEESDKRIAAMKKDPDKAQANPILPLLMPPLTRTYQQFLAAEASHTMLQILVAAAIYSDFVREWPEDLKVLEQFAGVSFAPDPFTMKPIDFDQQRDGVRVRIRAPKWIGKETRIRVEFDLDEVFERNAKNYEALVKSIDEKQRAQRRQALEDSYRRRLSGDEPLDEGSGRSPRRDSRRR